MQEYCHPKILQEKARVKRTCLLQCFIDFCHKIISVAKHIQSVLVNLYMYFTVLQFWELCRSEKALTTFLPSICTMADSHTNIRVATTMLYSSHTKLARVVKVILHHLLEFIPMKLGQSGSHLEGRIFEYIQQKIWHYDSNFTELCS